MLDALFVTSDTPLSAVVMCKKAQAQLEHSTSSSSVQIMPLAKHGGDNKWGEWHVVVPIGRDVINDLCGGVVPPA